MFYNLNHWGSIMVNQLEAIKLVKDWSTWLVAVQTGVLGLFAALQIKPSSLTVYCFVISIITATWVLGALPSLAQRIAPNLNIHEMELFEWCPIPLWKAAFVQHIFFIIGVVTLAIKL